MTSNLVGREQQVICAVSTPPGYGGIAVIRVSGADSERILRSVAPFLPSQLSSHSFYYGHLLDSASGHPIDEVIVLYFESGRSFTGEKVFEIQGHGNPVLSDRILQELVVAGARIADRGEFTYRAFLNQRLDLIQAESVLDLIQSQSSASAQMALRQLQGELSVEIEQIENTITHLLSHIEASIDFSTENLETISKAQIQDQLIEVQEKLTKKVSEYKNGRMIREGLMVSLAGRPNVGKSSLLNLLIGQNKAIVTPLPGTTRDLIESAISYMGQKIIFVDTAGVRNNAEDVVEKIGIEKSKESHRTADFVFFLFDLSVGLTLDDEEILASLATENIYLLGNKSDLVTEKDRNHLKINISQSNFFKTKGLSEDWVTSRLDFISTLDKNNRELLLNKVVETAFSIQKEDRAILTHARHFEKLSETLAIVVRVRAMIEQNVGAEFLSQDLKEALVCVQEVLGKHYDDQIVDKIFKEFCLGK
jgi:tRNA modification GTPase